MKRCTGAAETLHLGHIQAMKRVIETRKNK
jgi:hypothetical protein